MLQKIVIIGAGPAGLLLTHYLLRRGKYRVELYERRADPRLVDVSQRNISHLASGTREKGNPQDNGLRGGDRLEERVLQRNENASPAWQSSYVCAGNSDSHD